MRSKRIKFMAFAFAFCLGAVSLTGCGDKNADMKEAEQTEIHTEEPAAAVPEETSETTKTEEAVTTTAAIITLAKEDITYAPSDGMMSVGLSSGIVQIGGDIFKNGGYYTVDEFISKFGDRYDMSQIDPDGVCSSASNRAIITSRYDEDISVEVLYSGKTDSEMIRKGDAIVYSVIPSYLDNVWYAKGISSNLKDQGVSYDDAKEFYNGFGYTEGENNDNSYGVYDKLTVKVVGDETNLFGCKPVYTYAFTYSGDSVTKFRLLDVRAIV